MAQFPVESGQLLVGGMQLSRLAARVGRTPFYAYDRRLITERVEAVRAALPEKLKLHYAMKANPMPAVVHHMAGLVDGMDVASAGELKVALDAGVDPHRISLAGPGKSDAELEQAVAAGIMVNIESAREIDMLAHASQRLGLPARIAVRVNPDFELKSSGMRMGGGAKQFGIDAEQVPSVLAKIGRAGLSFEGFHLFAGSQNLNAEAISEAQRRCFDLAFRLSEHAPAAVKSVNLGGGFGIPYFPGERRLDLTSVGTALRELHDEAVRRLPTATLIIELGRYLVGEAGIYVCRILDRKISRGRVFLVADGGLHHHLAASGNFGQIIRKNYPVVIGNKMHAPRTERASVVGPLCTPLDTLADNMYLARAEPGDLVVIFQSGAYGATASPQRFLGHPSVTEVLM